MTPDWLGKIFVSFVILPFFPNAVHDAPRFYPTPRQYRALKAIQETHQALEFALRHILPPYVSTK